MNWIFKTQKLKISLEAFRLSAILKFLWLLSVLTNWEQNCYVNNDYAMLKSLWGYIEFGISEKGNPRSRTFGRTQDPRPRIHLIGESRYPRPGAVYPSHGLEPRPVTIKVGLNILSIYGSQDPRAGTLNMNDSGALCVYVYFACLSCILRQEHF